MPNAQQMEFLDGIEAGQSSAGAARPARTARGVRLFGGAVLAGASLISVFGSTAEAATPVHPASPASVDSCFEPDHVPHDHAKGCGLAQVVYDYQYTYSPNQALQCYVFEATYFGCGGASGLGIKESCAH